ncbi:beta-ketoacyl reductase, partial [Streptomyces sp. NPDC046931]|uniref:beta-ketoacyl reductase n=1 Tax=Streptomyces sp. NPDC046931 TaxID=3154806 RepID=UPI0033C90548
AANAFLDALMARRRAEGLPGLAIGWGPWAEVGMAARDSADHEKTGLRPIPADSGARIAVRLACAGPATAGVAVVPADWAAFRNTLGDTLPDGYLDRLSGPSGAPASADARRAGGERHTTDRSPSLRAELATARDPRALLGERVELMLRRVLGSRRPVGRHQGFASLGMDSLMAVEFRARLSQALELKLPTTLAFTHPNLDDLVPFLAQQLALPSDDPAGDPAGDAEQEGPGGTAPVDTSASELMARISEKYRTHRRA